MVDGSAAVGVRCPPGEAAIHRLLAPDGIGLRIEAEILSSHAADDLIDLDRRDIAVEGHQQVRDCRSVVELSNAFRSVAPDAWIGIRERGLQRRSHAGVSEASETDGALPPHQGSGVSGQAGDQERSGIGLLDRAEIGEGREVRLLVWILGPLEVIPAGGRLERR